MNTVQTKAATNGRRERVDAHISDDQRSRGTVRNAEPLEHWSYLKRFLSSDLPLASHASEAVDSRCRDLYNPPAKRLDL